MYGKLITDAEYVVFDFETTGLSPFEGAEPVEVGALRLKYAEVLGHIVEFIRPSAPIPAETTAVHGITDDMVAAARPVGEVIPDFLDFAKGAVLVAQNLAFDLAFLAAGCRTAGKDMPNLPAVDIIGLSKRLLPDLGSYKLETTAAALGVRLSNAHRALGDVGAEAQIFLAYVRELARRDPSTTVGDMILFSKGVEEGDPELLVYLDRAAAKREPVRVLYAKEPGTHVDRTIIVYGLYTKDRKVYVNAFDQDKNRERTFLAERLSLRTEGHGD